MRVLLVEDEVRLADNLAAALRDGPGFAVDWAEDGEAGDDCAKNRCYDLIVLDLMLPKLDGLGVLKRLRAREDPTPVLILTAKDGANSIIQLLNAGADDYLAKPFEPRELVLRINAILRRLPPPGEQARTLRLGRWTYHLERDELRCGDEILRLTTAEAALLRVLAVNPGMTLSREDLTERARIDGNARSVDVQVTRLRRKIEDDPRQPRYLHTVRGEGYVLRPD